MNYATELYFDQDSQKKISEYLEAIRNEGVDNLFYNLKSLAHISLAVYDDGLDPLALIKDLKRFRCGRLQVRFASIGFFCSSENTVFLNPGINRELFDLHERYHREFKKYMSCEWKYYWPGHWTPHCSMAFEVKDEDFMKILKILKKRFQPIEVTIERIGFIKFRPIETLFVKSL